MSASAERALRSAAFFDVDGTLIPGPSLERRLFVGLRRERAIPLWNYARWGTEALRLLPGGIEAITQRNKRYLTGLRPELLLKAMDGIAFFKEGVARVEYHARRGDQIVLVTGTIKPLARLVAVALECELEAGGSECEVLLSATRVEESEGYLTGRILGEANYGEAKRRALLVLARAMQIDVRESHAYGNTLRDRAMLEAVGHAHAVNPGKEFAQLANLRDWPIWHWHHEQPASARNSSKKKEKLQMIGTAL
jgi:phosphoserine phosphatase